MVMGCLFILPLLVNGQTVDRSEKLDSMTLSERISVRTNSVDWLLLVPNVSVEFDLGKYNWNRYAISVGLRTNWQSHHTFKPAQVYNINEMRAEFRQYWRTRKIIRDTTAVTAVMPAKNIFSRLLSTNRDTLKHPNTTYYRGIYASYTKYSFLLGATGRQGTGLSLGFTYGIIKPLYQFQNGNSLDLDIGFSAGVCITKNDKYRHDRESDCYPLLEHSGWHIVPFPVMSEARIAFVYRFGSFPVTHKYRWRYDVDEAYRNRIENKLSEKTQILRKKTDMESLRREFDRLYRLYYPGVEKRVREQKGGAR